LIGITRNLDSKSYENFEIAFHNGQLCDFRRAPKPARKHNIQETGTAGAERISLIAVPSDFAKLAALNKPDEFIPLGMRQPNRVLILADCDALLRNLDFRASRAGWAKCELFAFHSKPL
jgi:hypothetical protein